jgi:hypothetical protein
MSHPHHSVLTLTATAIATFEAFKCIGFDDQIVSADDAAVKGISVNPATEIGMDVALHALGPIYVTADGVIAKGDQVIASASADVKTAPADPANVIGHALTAAADGDLVNILFR